MLETEDNESAEKWLSLIDRLLNKQSAAENPKRAASSSYNNTGSVKSYKSSSPTSGSLFFQKTSLRKYSKKYRTEKKSKLKSCNCPSELGRKNSKESCFSCQDAQRNEEDLSSEDDDGVSDMLSTSNNSRTKYGLIVSKQMGGTICSNMDEKGACSVCQHLRTSCINLGIKGCLGNKGCVSVSFTFPKTTFCFICRRKGG